MSPLRLLAIPLIAMSLSAFAQTSPPPSGSYNPCPATGADTQRSRFVDADKDHDGRLSRTEVHTMLFVAKHFDAIDTDHDGYISRAELRAARERFQAARSARCGGKGQNSASRWN